MSLKNERFSMNSDQNHSNKLIILSKSRLSSAKNPSTLVICQEGDVKVKIQIKDSIDKQKIDSTLKNMTSGKIKIKNSRSFIKFEPIENQKNNLSLKKNILKINSNINNDITTDPENFILRENINYETNRNYNINTNGEKNNKKIINDNDDDTVEKEEMKDDVIFNMNNNFNYMKNEPIKKYNSSKVSLSKPNNSFEQGISSKFTMKNIKKENSNLEGMQQSDKAAVSISEQDNITDFDKRTKIIPKFNYETLGNRNLGINEDELENESINNKENLITESKKEIIDSGSENKEKNDKKSLNKSDDTIKIEDEGEIQTIKVENIPNNNNITLKDHIKNNFLTNKDNNCDYNDNSKPKISNFNNINNTTTLNKKNTLEKEISKNQIKPPTQDFKSKNIKLQNDSFLSQSNIKASVNLLKGTNFNYKNCSICERSYPLSKLYVAECKIHYLCRKCAKNYYEDAIENGERNMCCPFKKCKQPMDRDILKSIISQEHYSILTNYDKINNNDNNKNNIRQSFYCAKLKTTIDNENLKLYTQKHVLDISTNKNFFNYNSNKDIICPNCYEESLFTKTNNTHFNKCLNCCCKKCKYCMREFNDKHMDINTEGHCKVYYRLEDEGLTKNNKCLDLLLQYFFVFASFYFMFAGSFLYIRQFFRMIFCTNHDLKFANIIKLVFVYIFTIIIFIVTIPVIVLFYPYFPYILAFSDIP